MSGNSFAYYPIREGAHIRVRVFVGQHLVGILKFLPEAWKDFRLRVEGPGHNIYAIGTQPTASATPGGSDV